MDKKLINLVRKIKDLDTQAIEYINKVMYPIDCFILDNEYSNCNALIQSALLKQVFGDMYEDISWFLYEWKPGYTIGVGDVTYVINSEEDYYKYLETQ